jgi:hypothetical protein
VNDAELEALLLAAASRLGSDLVEERPGRWQVEVRFADGRKQRVFLYLGEGSPHYRHLGGERRILFAASWVGPWREGLDAAALLRRNAESSLAMVSVFFAPPAGEPDFAETIYATAGLPLAVASGPALAAVIDEVAGMADTLEQELFHTDVH